MSNQCQAQKQAEKEQLLKKLIKICEKRKSSELVSLLFIANVYRMMNSTTFNEAQFELYRLYEHTVKRTINNPKYIHWVCTAWDALSEAENEK